MSVKELKAKLKSKGAKCPKCVEKSHFIERVLETWDWPPLEASSPDGGIVMTKQQFIGQMRNAWRKHQEQVAKGQEEAPDVGHELDGEDIPEVPGTDMAPDFEKAWADFSRKLINGEIAKDENGNVVLDVGDDLSMYGWWAKHQTHVIMIINLVLLIFLQASRAKDRSRKRQQAAETEAARKNKGD